MLHSARPQSKRPLATLVALAVLAGAVFFLPAGWLTPVQRLFVMVTLPFQNLFSWTAFELREWTGFWGSIRELKAENEQLTRDLLALKADRAALVSLREENEHLRREVGLAKSDDRQLVSAEVIARDESGLARRLRINRGTQQGIAPGMAVVSGGTVLVGRIERADPFSSEVRLLSHTESLVAAMVEGVAGQTLVRGDHGVGLLLDLARPNEKLEPGATVVTAGLNDGLPSGLLIGTIESVRLSGDQLFQQAPLVPPVRADTLRFMSVITDF